MIVIYGCGDGKTQESTTTPVVSTETAPVPHPLEGQMYLKITFAGVTPEYVPVEIAKDVISPSGSDLIKITTTDARIINLCEFPDGTSGSPLVEFKGEKDTIRGALSHKLSLVNCDGVKSVMGLVTPIEDMRHGARWKMGALDQSPLSIDGLVFTPIGAKNGENTNSSPTPVFKFLKPVADFSNYLPVPGAPVTFCLIHGDVTNWCVNGAITEIKEKEGKKVFLAFGHPIMEWEGATGLTGPVFSAFVHGQEFDGRSGSASQLMSTDTGQIGCVERETFWGISGDIGGDNCVNTVVEATVIDVGQKTNTVTKTLTHGIVEHREAWPHLVIRALIESLWYVVGFEDNYSTITIRGSIFHNDLSPTYVDRIFCGMTNLGQVLEYILRYNNAGDQPKKIQLVITRDPLGVCSQPGSLG